MATGQPGLSTPDGRSLESQSAQRMGECTRGCAVLMAESGPRAKPRRAGSRSKYTLASRSGKDAAFVSPIRHKSVGRPPRDLPSARFPILTRYLHIRATKSRHGQRIHEACPRNCPRSSCLSLVRRSVPSSLASSFRGSNRHSLFEKPLDLHILRLMIRFAWQKRFRLYRVSISSSNHCSFSRRERTS